MKFVSRLSILAAFCLSLAACATTPPPPPSDMNPPKQRLDPKTDLEYGKQPRRSQS